MKANMKRWIAMSLAIVMVLSLSACNGDNDPSGVDTSANGEAAEGTEKKRLDDLGGFEVKIADWYYTEVEPETEYQKATAKYVQDIQDEYNFKITRESGYAFQDIQETYVTHVMSNSPAFSLYYLYQEGVLVEPLMKGLMYNLKTVPTIDLTEEKWNKSALDLVTLNGGIYGMSTEQEPRGGVFFNKRLLEEAGIDKEEPYKLQREGKWTWEKFEEYCKKLTKDTDSDGKTDQYALASFSKDYLPIVAANNNATFIDRKEDGTYVNASGSKEFLEAMNWGISLITKGYIMPKPEGAAWDWFISAFRDCEVAMQAAEVYKISSFANMDDPWGFVMFPYNQANKDATNKTIPNDNIIALPSCYDAETAEKICFAYDLYTEATPNYTLDDIWKERYYTQFGDSYAVEETLEMMRQEEHKQLSFLPMISGLDYGEFCYGVYAGASTPAKQLEALKSKWDAKISDMNKQNENFKVK